VAGFVGGVAFRRYEFSHTYNRSIHDGAEVVEKFFELAVMLLLGSMLTLAGLGEPGLAGWLFIPVLLVLIRPLLVAAVFVRSGRLRARGRVFVGWFGVRGVAALFYLTYIVDQGVLAKPEQATVVWTVLACVAVSVLVHGVTSTPLEGLASGRESRDQAGRSTAIGSPAAVSDSAAP
jgi:NhaP-type Na+/H+ or K+/H+ antiporter